MGSRGVGLAGGLFLRELSDAIDSVLHSCVEEKDVASCIKEGLSGRTIELALAGRWRKFLASSLELAGRILAEVSSAYERVYGHVVDLKFKLLEKGLTGTGSGLFASIFEIGLEVDKILGLPYYPSSTVKGAVRSAAEELLGPEIAERLFGSPGARGSVGVISFSDVYPVGCLSGSPHPCLIITGDVVTPHYFRPDWGRMAEAEMDAKPTPIKHLAIAPGTVFRVIAGLDTAKVHKAEEILDRAIERGLLKKDEAMLGDDALLLLTARLVAAALASGFAARSAKGYNVLLPLLKEENVHRTIVSLKVRRGGG